MKNLLLFLFVIPLLLSAQTDYSTHTVFTTGLCVPAQLVMDNGGNIFVANHSFAGWSGPFTNTVAKVDPSGNKSVFIGGYTWPSGIAIDEAQNIYFTQNNASNVVTKVTPAGVASTFASLDHQPGPITVHDDGVAADFKMFTISHWGVKGTRQIDNTGQWTTFDNDSYHNCDLSPDGMYLYNTTPSPSAVVRINVNTHATDTLINTLLDIPPWTGAFGPDGKYYTCARSLSDPTMKAIFRINGINNAEEVVTGIPSANEISDLIVVPSSANPLIFDVYLTEVVGSNRTDPESNRIIKLQLFPPVAPPTPIGQSICGAGNATLTATATSQGIITWFDVATGGSPVATGNTFATPYITETTTYYVAVDSAGIFSHRVAVDAVVLPLPANLSQGTGGYNLTDGLVAYYPFNGNANDESGNGNHGINHGAASDTDRCGNSNSCFYFNGIDNWVEVANSPSIQSPQTAITMSAWILSEVITVDFICKIDGPSYNTYQYRTGFDINSHYFYYGMNEMDWGGNTVSTVSMNEWFLYTLTYNGSQVVLYINGQPVGGFPLTGEIIPNTERLEIARDAHGPIEWIKGKIDELRLYNRALSAEEVMELFNSNCSPLLAYLTSDTLCRGSLAQLNLLNPQAGIGYALQVDSVDVTPLIFSTSDTLSLLTPALWQNASLTVRAVDTATGCEITLDSVWAVTVVAPETVVTTGVSVCPGDTATLIVTGGVSYLWSTGSTNDTIVVAPVVTTTYYAIAYSEMGCSDTAFTTVTVLPLPVVQAQSNSPVCEGDSLLLNASGAATYTWTGPGFSSNLANAWVFPTAVSNTGWYYATGTSQQGCTQTDSVWAEVLTAFNTVQQIGICQGESYTLPGGTIVTTGGTYVDTLSSSFGCDSIITTQLTIKPLPLIAIAGSSPMCQDETLMVSAAGGVSYHWTGPVSFTANTATATIPNAQPVNTGYYTVAVTGQNGCTDFDSVYVKVLPPDYREENIGICQGESYTLPNGITTYTSGTWVDTLTNIYGCDSIIATIVTVNPNPVAMAQSNAPVCEGSPLQFTLNGGAAYHWSGPSNWTSSEQSPEIVHPMPYQSGWYFATLINEHQCYDTDSLFVLINAQSLNVVKDSLCQGSSYQLPGGSIVSTPGIYTDTLASPTTQCDSIVLTWLTLKPQPQVSLASNSPVCIGSDVMVLVNGGIEWQWTGPNGFASDQPEAMVPMATAADSGWYYLHTLGDNGCTRTDSLLVDVHDCTGIGEWPDGLTVKVMPNPFDEKIVVELASTLHDRLKFELNSADGKMVKSNTMDMDSGVATVTISTSDLPVGFYLLKISGQQFYRVYNLLKIK